MLPTTGGNANHLKIAATVVVLLIATWFVVSGQHRTAFGYTNVDNHHINTNGATNGGSNSAIGATPRSSCSGCPCPTPTLNCTCNVAITPDLLAAAVDAHNGKKGVNKQSPEEQQQQPTPTPPPTPTPLPTPCPEVPKPVTCSECKKCDDCKPCDRTTTCGTMRPPLPTNAVALPDAAHGGRNGTLVIYSYFEDPDPMKPAKQNFEFFIEVGMQHYLNHPHVHFFIIVNGDQFTVKLPEANNIFVHRRSRNFGMDICAYAETFPLVDSGEIKLPQKLQKYRHFIQMNASVRGPFMPAGHTMEWLDFFLAQINDKVKMVGTSINCLGNHHVDAKLPGRRYGQMHLQSMFLAYDYMILDYVRAHLPCGDGWEIPVFGGEVQFTVETLAHGYGIASQLLSFRGVDFTDVGAANAACDRSHGGDHYFPGNYNGINISPLEVIFYKANRDVDTNILNKYTDWVLQEVRSRPKT